MIITILYLKDLCQPQTGLLRYVLEQPYSREMVGNMLGLNKQVKTYLVFLKKGEGHFSIIIIGYKSFISLLKKR